MPRPKGLPKTGGRKPGSKNRSNAEIREALVQILSNNLEKLQDCIDGMEDKEAGKLLVSLARHLTYPEVAPERLSEQQLLQVLEYLKNQNDEG